jgi:hypothetical protein
MGVTEGVEPIDLSQKVEVIRSIVKDRFPTPIGDFSDIHSLEDFNEELSPRVTAIDELVKILKPTISDIMVKIQVFPGEQYDFEQLQSLIPDINLVLSVYKRLQVLLQSDGPMDHFELNKIGLEVRDQADTEDDLEEDEENQFDDFMDKLESAQQKLEDEILPDLEELYDTVYELSVLSGGRIFAMNDGEPNITTYLGNSFETL